MNIAIIGIGKIAHRVAQGIIYSNGTLLAVASRDREKAKKFANQYNVEKAYTYEDCFKDEEIDLIYITSANPTHYPLVQRALLSGKHVICEKPFVKNLDELNELFDLAKKQHCFLMEAHKTCFTPLNVLLKSRIDEIGNIISISANYSRNIKVEQLPEWHFEPEMGGCFFDVGVYPICFANYYADSCLQTMKVHALNAEGYLCDLEGSCQLFYENGVRADLKASWIEDEKCAGIICGEKGRIEIENFWKNTEAKIITDHEEIIQVNQKSDFTGEINHAIECIEKGMIESPVMSKQASAEVLKVLMMK